MTDDKHKKSNPSVKKKAIVRRAIFFILAATLAVGLLLFWTCLPDPLFNDPYSAVILDRDGELLGASIAADEQWRFPPVEHVPEKYVKAVTCFEDRRFFLHPGVDPVAVGRALIQNVRAGRIVSGASTLTMQVIRISRKGKSRTVSEKCVEAVLAFRLEIAKTKEEILSLYAAHAPFGGNVVGLEAASWRYFGREPEKLSWAETATLAILPNSPSLIHPGRNRKLLRSKRDRLLDRLFENGEIDEMSCKLAKEEPLPPKPHPIPMLAPHLLERIRASGGFSRSPRFRTTLEKNLQKSAIEIVERHHRKLAGNGVHNAAALILEVDTGNVLAYVGNIHDLGDADHGNHVDVITAPRSTGSILKPFLYAGMASAGELLPSQLVPDVPTRMWGGFAPKNYNRTYQGAVPAYMALARSLNIPAVRMLWSFGVDRFYLLLKSLGMTTLHRPARDYGLTLILGGAEGTLWEITGIYAGMARRVNNHFQGVQGPATSFSPPNYTHGGNAPNTGKDDPLTAGACQLAFQAMLEVVRPGVDSVWREFSSSRKIAWKTGTSYGLRDAWAVGSTPRYTVGVWAGNADGLGRPGLTGIGAAAPILFELFGRLDGREWFGKPESDLAEVDVCAKSGYRVGPYCAASKPEWITATALKAGSCPYCKIIHCDSETKYRVHGECERIADIRQVEWFVLPPAMEWYYKRNHSDYRPLPPYRPDCLRTGTPGEPSMTIIYPGKSGKIYVPIELDGTRGRTVFEATHRDSGATVYWHVDEEYIGETADIHQMTLAPEPGKHMLTLVDENGERVARRFTVLSE